MARCYFSLYAVQNGRVSYYGSMYLHFAGLEFLFLPSSFRTSPPHDVRVTETGYPYGCRRVKTGGPAIWSKR